MILMIKILIVPLCYSKWPLYYSSAADKWSWSWSNYPI